MFGFFRKKEKASGDANKALANQGQSNNIPQGNKGIEIAPADVKKMMDSGAEVMLLDVREKWENDTAKIEGSNLIPLDKLPAMMEKLPKNIPIVAYCHHGNRSLRAAIILKEKGLDAKSMRGGIAAWSREVDSKVPAY